MTLEEMNTKMTLFYSKSSGEIQKHCTGVQSMAYFNVNEEDFSLIWDFVVLPKDEYVMSNKSMFKINLQTKTLEIKPDQIPSYPVAQS